MMTNARGKDNLITALHLQPLFKSAPLECNGAKSQSTAHAAPANDQSQKRETGQFRNFSVLLQELGVDTSAAPTGSINQNAIATARATAKIADWMTYLPKDCVKAMVNNGWHWST
jgi:hypothetical protein